MDRARAVRAAVWQVMRSLIANAGVPWLQAVEQFEMTHRKALEHKLDEILKLGGEGLMLHRADALYTTGRSDVLLKMKLWHDAEATVIAYQSGKGKYTGMLGVPACPAHPPSAATVA